MATVYTEAGEDIVSDYTNGDAAAPANFYIGWGTGNTPAAKGDTTLDTASAEARVIGANTQPTSPVNQWVGTITSAGGQTIEECGLFDAIVAGNMLIRSVFAGVVLLLGDKIEFTITLEQT